MSKNVSHELFVCDCSSVSHQFVVSAWDFNDGNPMLDITIKLNIYQPWYKRILIAIKYLFKVGAEYQFDTVILNSGDIDRLSKSLEEFKELEKKALIEDYHF